MTKKISVMLIDDNKIDLFIHHELIKQMNIANNVSEYLFASEALKHLQENDITLWPDLILLDIHMPVMNGFDFIDQYTLLPEEKRGKSNIVVVSSSLDTGDKLKSTESLFVLKLLEKPLNTAKLKKVLQDEKVI